MSADIIIIGAGITGSTLASLLAPSCRVLLVDRDVHGLPGSTGHAPGFVGQFNEVPVLTELARRTVKHYLTIPRGFDVVGGLEIARESSELPGLDARAALATKCGLEARVVGPEDARALAPEFVESAVGGLHFPGDGTANAKILARAGQAAATASGATLRDADAASIERTEAGYAVTLASGQVLTAGHVAVCTGIWAGQLLPNLAAAAATVSHPYAYSSPHAARDQRTPFVRWPSAHVYARDHGTRDGLGSYAHDPVHVSAAACGALRSAYGAWEPGFDGVLEKSFGLLPASTAGTFASPTIAGPSVTVSKVEAQDVPYAFNGMFTVLPDGVPLVGRLGDGLWVAVGVWVTHVAGSAGILADMVLEAMGKKTPEDGDAWIRKAIDPTRFEGMDGEEVTRRALATYNDIYNKDQ